MYTSFAPQMDLTRFQVQQLGSHLQAASRGGYPLETWLQRLLTQYFKVDFSSVRVHSDAEADRLALWMNARAFTMKSDIFFRAGYYDPQSRQGLQLLFHEITHMVQQISGLVGTCSGSGSLFISQPADPWEQEADAWAAYLLGQLAGVPLATAKVNPPPLAKRPGSSARAGLIVQRAIGLEIEIPVPIDQLTAGQVTQIQTVVRNETTAAAPLKAGMRVQAVGMRDMNGSVAYGTIRNAASGFRVDADHDDRVTTPNPATTGWPIRQGSRDSIIEIVMEPPALDQVDLTNTMNAIDAFITQINTNTNNLTTRWIDAFPALGTATMPLPVSVGPFDYNAIGAWYPPIRLPNHNFQGSVQVNIGIDLREYHSLLKWYVESDFARATRVTNPLEQDIYRQIKEDIRLAITLGRQITEQIYSGMTATDRQQGGKLRGLRGWLTHLALYLKRGTLPLASIGGSVKNLAPVLVKSPNFILTNYGMTAVEQNYFTANRNALLRQLCQRTGRPLDDAAIVAGNPLNTIDVFLASPGDTNLDTLSDMAAIAPGTVALTGKPVVNPTGVGPTRTGNPFVQGLPNVAAAPGIIGGGPNRRGGLLAEFRTMPGYYDGPASWRALATTFLAEAETRNNRDGLDPDD